MNVACAQFVICAFALAACGPEDVELVRYRTDTDLTLDDADVPNGLDSGTISEPHSDAGMSSELDARTRPDDAGAGVRSCASSDDCSPLELCSMNGCYAKKGFCTPISLPFCLGEMNPVCGCDGLRYFNDCLRQEARVNVDVTCSVRSCDRASPCPNKAKCSYLYKNDRTCRQTAPIRECWVLPTQCSLPYGGSVFGSCDPLSLDSCVSLCEAVFSEQPFAELTTRCGGRPPSTGPSNISLAP